MVSSADFLTSSLSTATSLSFSPIKLALLIGWVYLCLYCVQWGQFRGLAPKSLRSITNLATLFAGPILIFLLLVIDTIRRSLHNNTGLIETLTQQAKSVFTSLSSLDFIGFNSGPGLPLISGPLVMRVYHTYSPCLE